MRTTVIRICKPKKKHGDFPIELLAGDSEDVASLAPVAGARASIPAGLAPAQAVPGPDGAALTAARVRELYGAHEDDADAYQAAGTFLYRLLRRGGFGKEWERLRRAQAAQGVEAPPTRTILQIAPDDALRELRSLPWELMYDPETLIHPFLDEPHPMLRGVAGAAPPGFSPDDWPLRVLVVLGAEPEAEGLEPGISANAELTALEALFATKRFDVEFEVLEHPSPADVVRAVRDEIQPHILHFIGHGEAGADPAMHQLSIYQPADGARPAAFVPWWLHDIRTSLSNSKLRLAFLNACRSAGSAASTSAASPAGLDSIAGAFLTSGALGVIAMQGDVPGNLAAAFATRFYTELLQGRDVDVAMLAARKAVVNNVMRSREWSFPVLQTRVAPHLVLPRLPARAMPQGLAERMVARVPQRRLVRETVCAAPATVPGSPHLLVIKGGEDAGKSHLAKWCAQTCERRGLRTAYVSFGTETIDLLNALRFIRDGERPERDKPLSRAPHWPLPVAAFRRFTWELHHRRQGAAIVPPLPDDVNGIPDDATPLHDFPAPSETMPEVILGLFRLALQEAAGSSGLVLVLDQIEHLESPALTQWLLDGLFLPVAAGAVQNVRLVLVTRQDDYEKRLARLHLAPSPPTTIDVHYFAEREYPRLSRQLCLQWSEATYAEVKELLPKLLEWHRRREGWGGKVLRSVDKLCDVHLFK